MQNPYFIHSVANNHICRCSQMAVRFSFPTHSNPTLTHQSFCLITFCSQKVSPYFQLFHIPFSAAGWVTERESASGLQVPHKKFPKVHFWGKQLNLEYCRENQPIKQNIKDRFDSRAQSPTNPASRRTKSPLPIVIGFGPQSAQRQHHWATTDIVAKKKKRREWGEAITSRLVVAEVRQVKMFSSQSGHRSVTRTTDASQELG